MCTWNMGWKDRKDKKKVPSRYVYSTMPTSVYSFIFLEVYCKITCSYKAYGSKFWLKAFNVARRLKVALGFKFWFKALKCGYEC